MQTDILSQTKVLCQKSQKLQKSIAADHKSGKDISKQIKELQQVQEKLKIISGHED